jgi:hypothetical protein
MKKSKAIKLVLVSSLSGSGINTFGSGLYKYPLTSNFTVKSKASKSFTAMPSGYSYDPDSLKHATVFGFIAHISVTPGGWGFFGHHTSVSC